MDLISKNLEVEFSEDRGVATADDSTSTPTGKGSPYALTPTPDEERAKELTEKSLEVCGQACMCPLFRDYKLASEIGQA